MSTGCSSLSAVPNHDDDRASCVRLVGIPRSAVQGCHATSNCSFQSGDLAESECIASRVKQEQADGVFEWISRVLLLAAQVIPRPYWAYSLNIVWAVLLPTVEMTLPSISTEDWMGSANFLIKPGAEPVPNRWRPDPELRYILFRLAFCVRRAL
ncbi:hypothetical protein L226DRAFT_95627 [Lentinus tigrinus ALCF2SS1-7]|uniref:uncharacterized protein n=1 Tax=Lentinus tigrinus ALCF2SS1-7 TaxID=1328758 RepID=UPI001165D891|nr:hypothetical protein L226DRAFT_95627 [Lentinus tigrinus ALCF2SS1-7]